MKKKVFLIILVVVLIIFTIAVCTYVRRYNLLKNIGNAEINFTASDNFYFENIQNDLTSQKLYVKENKSARYSLTNNSITQRFYIDTRSNTMTVVDELNKNYFITNMQTVVGNKGLSNLPEISNYAIAIASNEYNFKSAFGIILSLHNISTEKDGDIEYIKVSLIEKEKNYKETVWLNKATLLPVKVEIGNDIRNYVFEKDNVTDENVNFAEANQYTLVEQ